MFERTRTTVIRNALIALVVTGAGTQALADVRAAHTADGAVVYGDSLAPASSTSLDLQSERAAVTPARMQGRWLAQSEDGSVTMLELRPTGGFSFDQQAQTTPEREYMCGDWSLAGGELSLLARTQKTRLATGEIQLSETAHTRSFDVLAARTDVLVLRSDNRTLTFYRRGA